MPPKRAFREPKSEEQEQIVSSILGPPAVVDEKKCNGLGEAIISDLGLADFDVPDEVLAAGANNVSQSARLLTFCVLDQSDCVKLTTSKQKERKK